MSLPGRNAVDAAPPSIHVFHGGDAHAVDDAVRRAVASVRDAAGPPVRFDGAADPGAVYQELYTGFLGGGRKVVVLKDAGGKDAEEETKAAAPDGAGRAKPEGSWAVRNKALLQQIFDAPPADAVFVLATPRWPLAGLKPPEARCVVRGFPAQKPFEQERQAPALVASLFAARRKRAAADAIRALLDRVGPEPGLLAEAAEVLALHVGDRAEVTRADVEAMIQGVRPGNAFHMTRACVMGEPKRALEELARMTAHAGPMEEFGPKTLGAIAWQYRLVARTVEALAAGAPREEALKPWYARGDEDRLVRRLQSLRGDPLARAREWILETDLGLKSSRLHPRVALELLVVRLAGLP